MAENNSANVNAKAANGTENINIATKNGTVAELSLSKLEIWFGRIERDLLRSKQENSVNHDADIPELALKFISRFGLKSPSQVITFLNSKAGKSVKEVIAGQLAEIACLKQEQLFEAREKLAARHRLLAFLLLGLAFSSHAKADLLRRIQEQINEQLEKEEKIIHEHGHMNEESLYPLIAAYEQEIHSLESLLAQRFAESEQLEADMAETDEKYKRYIKEMDIFEKQLIQELQDEKSFENQTSDSDKMVKDLLPPKIAQQKIQHLSEVIEHDAKFIASLIDSGDDVQARQLLHISNARNLNLAILKDMMAVGLGNKMLYKADGTPADSFFNAEFILAKEKKIVKDSNNEYYLLNQDENLDELEFNPERKASAKEAYLRLKPEFTHIKKLVQLNRHNEKEALSGGKKKIDRSILELYNQDKILNAARAQAFSILPTTSTPMLTPLMNSPVPRPALHVASKQTSLRVQTFTHLLRRNPSPTVLTQLREELISLNAPQKVMNDFDRIQPGQPVNREAFKSILTWIGWAPWGERFGVDVYKKNVAASLGSPESVHLNAILSPTAEPKTRENSEYDAPRPNPFKITPSRS